MPARAAGQEQDPLRPLQLRRGLAQLLEVDLAFLEADPAQEGVAHGARLLVDLLEHEVAVAALLGLDGVPGDALRRAGDLAPVGVGDAHRLRRHDHHVPVVEEQEVAGVGQEGRNVRGQEVLALPEAHHERRATAGGDELLRLAGVHQDEGVDAFHLLERLAHGVLERSAAEVRFHQMGDDLGVGLGHEAVAGGGEARFQREIVLDDPVVDHDQLALAVRVRVGVLLARPSVGGPAGVADAEGAFQRLGAQALLEVLQLADRAAAVQAALVDHGDARRVVPAVLEPAQALDDDGHRVPRPHVADDPAHVSRPLSLARE